MTELTPLDRAIRAARRGHHEAARRLLDDVLAADPSDQRALAWRARITDDPGLKADLLRRALALHPDSRWAADQLAALGDAGDAEAPSRDLGDVGRRAERIEHLQCPNCGGQVEVHPERGTQALACRHCGTVLDVTASQATVLGRFKKQYRPAQDIEPGAEFTWDGERHLVTGWLRYRGWDSEESWSWDEWQMVSDAGAVRYLSYASGEGFLLQTPVRPTPKVSKRGVELADGRVRFHEVSPAEITAMAGELTWRPRLGQTLRVAEGRRDGLSYSAELTADEVEVTAGPALAALDVWRALGRADKVQEIEDRRARAAGRRRTAGSLAWLWLLGGLALLAASALARGLGSEITQTAVTYQVQPVELPTEPTARAVALYDTVSLGRIATPRGAFVGSYTASPPAGAGLRADLALVPTGGGAAYPLGLRDRSVQTGATRTSGPRTVRGTALDSKLEVDLVLLVEREWDGGRPWTEAVSVPVSAELRRVWTPDPLRSAGGLALFLALAFFAFSRSGPRD